MPTTTSVDTGPFGTTDTETDTLIGNVLTGDALISRRALVAPIREGSPDVVFQALQDLEVRVDVSLEDADWDAALEDEYLPLELDAEIALDDEDLTPVEIWDDPSGSSADTAAVDDGMVPSETASIEMHAAWELLVKGPCCRFCAPKWSAGRGLTSKGKYAMAALDERLATFERIAEWLTSKRSAFLLSGNVWDLGCDALSEFEKEQPSVQQKHFIHGVLGGRMDESTFSRHVRAASLVWPDGTAPLDVLFSHQAHLAWVANVVRQLALRAGTRMTAKHFDQLKGLTVSKASQSTSAVSFRSAVEKANRLARTKWADVVAAFRQEMLGA